MFKLVIIIVIVIGFVAYTGIDVTSEYDAISKSRVQVFENIIDPLAKKILTHAAESDLDNIIDSEILKHGDKNE
jgi:hypothetical protein